MKEINFGKNISLKLKQNSLHVLKKKYLCSRYQNKESLESTSTGLLSDASQTKYDIIICGAGAAGLSLAERFCDESWKDKKILLLDRASKSVNDRTWCAWVPSQSKFDSIAIHRWPNLDFFGTGGFHKKMNPEGYEYRMIRGIDFYSSILHRIAETDHITYVQTDITKVSPLKSGASVETTEGTFIADHVFNSIYDGNKIEKTADLYVKQHFKGWFIKSKNPSFDPQTCTFMDFRIDQAGEIRFMYVMPTSTTEALVEVAIFSNSVLEEFDYDSIVADYIEDFLKIPDYEILEEEFGIIPMTNYPFHEVQNSAIIPIGTAAGMVKSSTGFAFSRIQKHTDLIIDALRNGRHPNTALQAFKRRYRLYDSILLDVFLLQKYSGAEVFTQLFRGASPSSIFKFLDEENSLLEDIRVMTKVYWPPFIKGFFRQIAKVS